MEINNKDLTTTLSEVKLDNPVIPASGTFGFGYEFADIYDINILGSIALKGTTKEERYGNELRRSSHPENGRWDTGGICRVPAAFYSREKEACTDAFRLWGGRYKEPD